ncbi:DUF4125 family protein [Demequina sp.]|uniref:DUF4125 family protein n=1 Tax=Demequina sp. TaxID=2050685 RepID=UPI003A889914
MDTQELAARLDAAEAIVKHEFAQFDRVDNEGGRAACQDNWPTFRAQRLSQFLTWPLDLLGSYARDLDDADATGRNLLTEKYARMMASTEPERFARDLEPHLPALTAERAALQERVIAQQVQWAGDFHARYPLLGAGMRTLRTSQDTLADTSFETYLRGELSTYSERTMAGYARLIDHVAARGENLTELTVTLTVRLSGFDGLADAEAAQAG